MLLAYSLRMSNGIDRAYSSPFFAQYTPPARVERESAVEEDVAEGVDQAGESSGSRRPRDATKTAANGDTFFGDDGFSFRDILDAVNPLNHIPGVSGMLEEATGHKVSTGAKLMGGLLTGPVGFVASLANVIFEQGTGKGVAESMVASLSGDEPAAVQVASAETQTDEMEVAMNTETLAPVDEVEVSDSAPEVKVRSAKPVQVALNDTDKQRALLDLYGGSVPSAHRSYQNAQMRTYFTDVKKSQVL